MTPLDDTPRNEDHVDRSEDDRPARIGSDISREGDGDTPAFDDIWSSIGPGHVPDSGEGPPTIRPADLAASPSVFTAPSQTSAPPQEKDLPVTEITPTPNPTDPITPAEALREELRIGVRMLQALDTQFKRAETLIQREEEAARRVDESIERLSRRFESIETGSAVTATVDAEEIERAATAAIDRVTAAADDAARQIHDRLERFVALDSRLDELDATMRTVERRLERLPSATAPPPAGSSAPPASPSRTTSGTLTVEPRIARPSETTGTTLDDSNPALAATVRMQLLVDRGEEVRRELRSDLEAICTASATLVEIVERAAETERTLRSTLATAADGPPGSGAIGDSSPGSWSIASILRRLADEFDATDTLSSEPSPTSAIARSISGITPNAPLEIDVSHGDGRPVRREPLAAPDAVTDAVGTP